MTADRPPAGRGDPVGDAQGSENVEREADESDAS